MNSEAVIAMLESRRDDKQREVLMRFFKTAPGQYGHGDEFLGLKVPVTRHVVKQVKLTVPPEEISKLLHSHWHEVRLCGLLLLVEEMKAVLPRKNDSPEKAVSKSIRREEIARFYLAHARCANNWDLVDLSCEYILGPWMRLNGDYQLLDTLAESENLWEQRIAVVTTFDFIRNGIYRPTLTLCDKLIDHPHDLIHKAMGWMLREIGKRDKETLTDYLADRAASMPRTTLRYAIERFPERERQSWLAVKKEGRSQ